ncbi:LacI family DNA-binding transcriptional regulator [Galbitalea soli]|uniref:LacI family transcriptional regulator n=1 Tax=Galbitalea soli TaxID=1268042 RepID=A0A7C9PLZ2_9MICO|nr:LacI family DNA-binding transcriptional regulator [Galbitalea soli]NEM90545.1 LacI family transcriptional regulator [Galbitalea soli]NYJ31260.1 DNA-binding LacI/PurR family transcriptional regulator [Galbitalea soli]
MTSIDDVARAAGVSIATVSRALRGLPNVSDATRSRVKTVADELGYVASAGASGLASGRTLTMGVVVPSVSRWFYQMALEGIDEELRRANYDMMLFNLAARKGDRERVFHRSILRKRTDALIALCLEFTPSEREQLLSLGHPTIVIGGPVKGIRHIGIDERATARAATQHLITLGHRRIAHVGGDDDEGLNRRVPLDRRRGFRDAMEAAGLAVRPEWLLSGRFSLAPSRAVVNEMLASAERPTAIVANSDEMAIGAIMAAHDSGLQVPGDLSVIGIDNHDLAESFGLTTMAQDPFEQGALGARILLDDLGGIVPPRRTSVTAPSHLIVRTSTAPPIH